MAISPIRASTKARAAATNAASSFGTLPVAGDGIAVFIWGSGSTSLTGWTCVDNQGVGNTYTRVQTGTQNISGLNECGIWFCPAIGATSGTFTVTGTLATGVSSVNVVAYEFTALVSPVDVIAQTNNGASTTTPVTGTTGATAQADEVALIVMCLDGSNAASTFTVPTNYTEVAKEVNNSSWQAGACDFRILTATGTQSATWTDSPAGAYSACIAVVKGAAGSTDPFPAGYYQHPRAYLRM